MAAIIHEDALDEKLGALEAARAWSPRVVSRLEQFIRGADDYDLFRINPVRYAADRNVDENEAIALFLHGTRLGIFEMQWHLVCAICAQIVESFRQLNTLHSHFVCEFCGLKNNASLDDYIHVTFTVSPQIREISYHRPDTLPIRDYYLRYHFSKDVQPQPNGMTHEDVADMITKHMTFVEPSERITFDVEAGSGSLHAVDMSNRATLSIMLGEDPEKRVLPMRLEEGEIRPAEMEVAPLDIELPVGSFHYKNATSLPGGKLMVDYKNEMEKRSPLWVVHYPAAFQPSQATFLPFLSGKRLLTTQTFHDLFRNQVIGGAEGINVKDITLLFTDLKGSTELYDQVGDINAYYLVRQHFEVLNDAIARHNGAVVKTIGDAVMGAYMTPVDALESALDMLRGLEDFNKSISQQLILKIGIHKGHSIAVTLNERLDYFGQNANIAARVQGLADANEIYITTPIHDYPGVDAILAQHQVTPEEATLKGVSGKVQVYRVTLGG